jgi:Tfp pilus assembly protein FimT
MDKQQVLSELKQLASSGQISRSEALAVFDQPDANDEQKHHFILAAP